MIKRVLITAGIASLLTACGGGGNTANVTNNTNANTAPRATNATIVLQPTSNVALVAPRVALRGASSSPQIGDTLKAEYTYEDSDNDPQGATTFRWLRDGVAIADATQQTYKLTLDDAGKNISVEITPVATSGVLAGSAQASAKVINTQLTPQDPLLADQWYIKNTGTAPSTWGQYTDLTKDADLRVQEAWKLGFTGEGIVTTVVDDGLDFTHPDLQPREESGLSYSQDKTNPNSAAPPAPTTSEQSDHGTSVAGIIGANNDTVGVVGIAPKTKLIGHRILGIPDANTDTNAKSPYVKILEDKVSQVSNHSYGDDDNGALYPQSTELYNEIVALVTQGNDGKGHTMLFAAGNGRANQSGTTPNYGDYAGLDMAQQHPYVLSISGFDANDKDVTYAEAGPATLVAGATGNRTPEDEVDPTPSGTKKPAAAMATTGRTDFDYTTANDYASHRDNGTKAPAGYNMAFNGTSAATPSVTGIAALLLSTNTQRPADSAISWRDVRWLLAKTARKIQSGKRITDQTTLNEDATTRVRETTIWEPKSNDDFGEWSHFFGFGAANAEAALKMALDNYTPLPALKQCAIPLKFSQGGYTLFVQRVTAAADCPATIEFVQVAYTVKANADINNLQLSMQTSGAKDSDKRVYLINKSTCSKRAVKNSTGPCKPTADIAVKGGTVAFMGDAAPGSKSGYKFAVHDGNGTVETQEESIAITGVTIYGH